MDATRLEEVLDLLRRRRTDTPEIEVKATEGQIGASVWDSVSAFANTHGGVVLLGVSETEGFMPVPSFDHRRVAEQFIAGMNPTTGKLGRAPTYTIEPVDTRESSTVLWIEVAENPIDHKPCFVAAKGVQRGSFRRVMDHDQVLSATEIYELETATLSQESDRAEVSGSDLDDLDPDAVDRLIASRSGSRALKGAATRGQQLTRLNVLTKSGATSVAGLLTLGRFPQQFRPRLLIDVTAHPTNEKARDEDGVRFLDRVLCEGSMPEAISDALAATARNLRTYSTVEEGRRYDHLEIPRDVLREAIANAVVHREYGDLFLGQPITVDIYPDRVEISNPGGLWGGKTAATLDDGTSRCRNQTLMQLLQHIPDGSDGAYTVEGQGGGVRMMISEMAARALDRPRFDIRPDQVTVVLRRHGAEIPSLRSWLRSLSTEPLSDREEAILLLARRSEEVTVTEVRRELGLDSDDVRRTLDGLMAKGLMYPTDRGAYVLWSPPPAPSGTDAVLLAALSLTEPQSVHELALSTGRSLSFLRKRLRDLVDQGLVTATAAPTSRNRKYLRSEGTPT